jgi:hypothetical protein
MTPENFFFGFGIADPLGIPLFNTEESVIFTSDFQFCNQLDLPPVDGKP